jgi:HSP20 family protein
MNLFKKNGNDLPDGRSFLTDLFDVESFFPENMLRLNVGQRLPAANVKENKDLFEVEMAAPGFDKKDFKVSLNNNILTISAEKEMNKEEEEKNFTRKEFSYTSFSRSFEMPEYVKPEDIKASYKDGILKLEIPKKEEFKKITKKEIMIE